MGLVIQAFLIILALVSVGISSGAAAAANAGSDSELLPGQCYALVFSKSYVKDSRPSYTSFECSYRCRVSDSQIDVISARHSFLTADTERDGSLAVCAGVKVEINREFAKPSYEFVGAFAFYAVDNTLPEFGEWVTKSGVRLPDDLKAEREAKMFEGFESFAETFKKLGPSYQEQAAQFEQIYLRSPDGTVYFNSVLSKLRANPHNPNLDKSNVVEMATAGLIRQHAAHLIY